MKILIEAAQSLNMLSIPIRLHFRIRLKSS
jgi:hypothetical protein